MKSDEQKLNELLNKRLFFSNDDEYATHTGYSSIKGSGFSGKGAGKDSAQNVFKRKAYYYYFSWLCHEMTNGSIDLDELLETQYEATLQFYRSVVRDRISPHEDESIAQFFHYLFLREFMASTPLNLRARNLCKKLETPSDEIEDINCGLLFLLMKGIISTTKEEEIDIQKDFEQAYNSLRELSRLASCGSIEQHEEMLCLKEFRRQYCERQIEQKNRLVLISLTEDILLRIFSMKDISALYNDQRFTPFRIEPAQFWIEENKEQDFHEFWEFEATNLHGVYYLYKKSIDYRRKQVLYTSYQILLWDKGLKNSCFAIIHRPKYTYNMVLSQPIPYDAMAFDYPEFTFDEQTKALRQIRFCTESPEGLQPLTLNPITDKAQIRHYQHHLRDFTAVDKQELYKVDIEVASVVSSDTALFYKVDGNIFKIDKLKMINAGYDKDEETISALSNNDNCIIARLKDSNGHRRRFLIIDPIIKIDLDAVDDIPYISKVNDLSEVFSSNN